MRQPALHISTALFLAFLAAACGSGETRTTATPSDPAGRALARFHTAVAKDVDRQFEIYWLGESFAAGGLEYFGPNVPDFGSVNESGRLDLHYAERPSAPGSSSGPSAGISLRLFSAAQWETEGGSLLSSLPGTPKLVRAGDREASLYSHNLSLYVIVEPDETTTVLATVLQPVGPGGTPVPSPMADEETLLAVLADLRPYPD